MTTLDFPYSHMFIATCNKLGIVIWVKFNVEYRKYTGVSKT